MNLLNIDAKGRSDTQEDLLTRSLATASTKILGENGARTLLYHLHLENGVDVQTIHQRLQDILGTGAYYLETAVVEELYRSTGFPGNQSSRLDFVRLVEEAKEQLSSRRAEGTL